VVTPTQKREAVTMVSKTHLLSHRKSCVLIGISRRTFRYKSIKNDDALIEVLLKMSQDHPGYGFWKLYYKLRQNGYTWNHKRVYRVYTQLKLNIRRRVRKRLPKRVQEPLIIPKQADIVWSMDFVHDSLYDGKRYRILNIADDFNRELLAIEIDTSISAERVVRVLERLKQQGRLPQKIRVDNGPEFIAKRFQKWCFDNQIVIHYIQPGKPVQNSIIERINKSCRDELLNVYLFKTINEVENYATKWQLEYNYNSPHKSLGYKSPKTYAKEFSIKGMPFIEKQQLNINFENSH